MKKRYKIEVDCANCANEIEDEIKKESFIRSVSVNFMGLTLSVEYDESEISEKDLKKKLLKIGRKVDSDFVLY